MSKKDPLINSSKITYHSSSTEEYKELVGEITKRNLLHYPIKA